MTDELHETAVVVRLAGTEVPTNAELLRGIADYMTNYWPPMLAPDSATRLRTIATTLDRITLVEIQSLQSVGRMNPDVLPGYGVPINTAAEILYELWQTP